MENKCSKCDSFAVYHARHFGLKFCKRHFREYMFSKLRRVLYEHKPIRPNDKIVFELDGGPSSAGAFAAALGRDRHAQLLRVVQQRPFEDLHPSPALPVLREVDLEALQTTAHQIHPLSVDALGD